MIIIIIKTNEQMQNISSHKFIETPDRYYINFTAYDKNLSNIKGDTLGIKINNAAQLGNNPFVNYSTYNYNGPQSRNMIGTNSYQLVRDEGNSQSGITNGVIRDSTYPNISHIICGTDKTSQLISIDEYSGKVKLNIISNLRNASYNYNYLSLPRTEILCQTDIYIYVLTSLNDCSTSGGGSSQVNTKSYQITKIIKAPDVLSVSTIIEKNTCNEFDGNKTSFCPYGEDKAYKIYEDIDYCLVLSSTCTGYIILNIIYKKYNNIVKKILYYKSISTYKPIIISDSFTKDGYLYAYASSEPGKIVLIKIDISRLDFHNIDGLYNIEECSIDLSFLSSIYVDNNNTRSFTSHIIINDIDGVKYASIFNTKENNNNTYFVYERVLHYKISSDFKSFTLLDKELNDRNKMMKHLVRLDKNKIMMLSDFGAYFYSFSKIKKTYLQYHCIPFEDVEFVTKTNNNKIFSQDKFGDIRELVPINKTFVELKFNKDRYLSSEKDGTLNVSISNEFGDYLNGYKIDIKLIGCTFSDGSSLKSITVDNGNYDVPIKIIDTKSISSKAFNLRR